MARQTVRSIWRGATLFGASLLALRCLPSFSVEEPGASSGGIAGASPGGGGTPSGGTGGAAGSGGSGGTAGAAGADGGGAAGADGGGTGGSGGDAGGVGGTAGDAGAGGAPPTVGPSCAGLANNCGPAGNGSCCEALPVPGGSYDRINDPNYPSTISGFWLDRYEVTVGRFRKFVDAGGGLASSAPTTGAGEHPKITNSGWQAGWSTQLPATGTQLSAQLACTGEFATWTGAASANENRPITCVTWYLAMAFCIWDGGRLPTETEWRYAAAGGSDQRLYPWSVPPTSALIDTSRAAYDCLHDGVPGCALTDIAKVGVLPAGDGKWGHADLAGNVWEWSFDYEAEPYQIQNCIDCAQVSAAGTQGARGYAGGAFSMPGSGLTTTLRQSLALLPHLSSPSLGFRCARDH